MNKPQKIDLLRSKGVKLYIQTLKDDKLFESIEKGFRINLIETQLGLFIYLIKYNYSLTIYIRNKKGPSN